MTEIVKVVEGLDRVAAIVLDTVAMRSKRDYSRALLGSTGKRATGNEPMGFLPWLSAQGTGLNRMTVNAYIAYLKAEGVTASSINQRLSAIRKLAGEAADNGLLDRMVADSVCSIKNIKVRGEKLGNWLTTEQAEKMLNAPDAVSCKGIRDRAILAIMLGAGLRREEVVGLRVDHFAQREGRWVILNLTGKRNKTRTVPIAGWIKGRVDAWLDCADIDTGVIFRRVRRGGHIQNEQMTAQGVWEIVQQYAPVTHLAPHDLRRTFAKLCDKGGAPLSQIQQSLGHESIQTTQIYIGSTLDLQNAPSDFIKFDLSK